jgi:DNA adenine methylase
MSSNLNYTKPFLKWVGGKTQIIDDVLDLFPETTENYHEIFVGGGSVLFGFLDKIERGEVKLRDKVYAYDSNKKLINLYKNIQSNLDDVKRVLDNLIKDYNECKSLNVSIKAERNPQNLNSAKKSKEAYYYWIRNNFNKPNNDSITESAMFIFLNKTCFRGVYREGPNGFNVPFGNYKNPGFYEDEHLHHISNLIRDVVFNCCDFRDSLKNPKNGDFVYLDPPYADTFSSYQAGGFDLNDHLTLFSLTENLPCKFLMSNSYVDTVIDNFIDKNDFSTIIIECKRTINSKNPGAKSNECLILKS